MQLWILCEYMYIYIYDHASVAPLRFQLGSPSPRGKRLQLPVMAAHHSQMATDDSWQRGKLEGVKLCRFEIDGKCQRKEKCGFAHSVNELKKPEWKTVDTDFPMEPGHLVRDILQRYLERDYKKGLPIRTDLGVFRLPSGEWRTQAPHREPRPSNRSSTPAPAPLEEVQVTTAAAARREVCPGSSSSAPLPAPPQEVLVKAAAMAAPDNKATPVNSGNKTCGGLLVFGSIFGCVTARPL